jgi:hypothetical protein
MERRTMSGPKAGMGLADACVTGVCVVLALVGYCRALFLLYEARRFVALGLTGLPGLAVIVWGVNRIWQAR